jgi:hypothetical protein
MSFLIWENPLSAGSTVIVTVSHSEEGDVGLFTRVVDTALTFLPLSVLVILLKVSEASLFPSIFMSICFIFPAVMACCNDKVLPSAST